MTGMTDIIYSSAINYLSKEYKDNQINTVISANYKLSMRFEYEL